MLLSLLNLNNFAAVAGNCKAGFFGLTPWYQYLNVSVQNGTCSVTNFNFPGDLTLVALAIAELLLRVAGLVAVGFIIYGGIKYVISQGEPDGVQQAQNTVINACIGLVIAIFSTAIVAFVGHTFGD
ncbi:MAG TPA: hypothetical protein VJ843_05895 [Candidatus Saccharimonadales bacterium]|nr:hypothetical protein [Candidatus Saccharimonadales bacterium]